MPSSPKSRPSLLRSVLPLIGRHRRRFFTAQGVVNSARLIEAGIPYFVKLGVDRLAAGQRDLLMPVLAILGLGLARYAALSIGRRNIRTVAIQIGYEMRQKLYCHLQRQAPAFFARYPIGDLMARAISDIAVVRQFIGQGTRLMLLLSVTAVVAFACMAHLDLFLALSLFTVVPALVGGALVLARRIYASSTVVQAGFSDLSTAVQENLHGIRTIQAHAQEDRVIAAFQADSAAYAATYYRLIRWNSAMTTWMSLGAGTITLLVVAVGGGRVLNGAISVGTFTAFLFYMAMLLQVVKESGTLITLYQRAGSAAARLFELLDLEPEIADAPDARPLERVEGRLELRDLSHSFAGVPALDGVSLEVAAGETVAVMGRVGAGKSTLLRLLTRILDPIPGTVFLDGRDIRTLPLAQLRGSMSYVGQDPFLFAACFAENIAYDEPDRPPEQIWQAAEAADLDATISRYPTGLETVLGERGVTLSGGQKQRTALARGLIREAPVLLLDDCFSAVDTETEELILSRLKALRRGQTTILVSHRVSTARHADRIVMMENGRIVEAGPHEHLLALGGAYARLARSQTAAGSAAEVA